MAVYRSVILARKQASITHKTGVIFSTKPFPPSRKSNEIPLNFLVEKIQIIHQTVFDTGSWRLL